MIHNFFVSCLKKRSTHFWVDFFLGLKALELVDYTTFKQNPLPLFYVWVSLDKLMGNQWRLLGV